MSDRIMFQTAGKERPLTMGAGLPLLNSQTTPWAGLTFEVHRMQTIEGLGESGPLDHQHGLLVWTSGQIEIVRRDGKGEVTKLATAGSAAFMSGENRPRLTRMKGNAEAVALHFSREWFRRVLLDDAPREFGNAAPIAFDATLLALTTAMRDEVSRGAVTGKLFAESLSVALLSYVLERVPPSTMSVRGNLTEEHQRRLRKHMLENLGEDLSLDELSALVGRGPRQFTTLFRRAFGTTPHRYLVTARLAEGARLLEEGHLDLAEIALRVGFCSQSHFADSFRRAYGITPGRYASGRRSTSG
jgi:AraC-like DNA-binding protein